MNATKSRSDRIGRGGGGGTIRSRWNESRRSVRSMRCATTSRTTHRPAIVDRSQSSGRSARRSDPSSCDTGRKRARVSVRGMGESGIAASYPDGRPTLGAGGNPLIETRDPRRFAFCRHRRGLFTRQASECTEIRPFEREPFLRQGQRGSRALPRLVLAPCRRLASAVPQGPPAAAGGLRRRQLRAYAGSPAAGVAGARASRLHAGRWDPASGHVLRAAVELPAMRTAALSLDADTSRGATGNFPI